MHKEKKYIYIIINYSFHVINYVGLNGACACIYIYIYVC